MTNSKLFLFCGLAMIAIIGVMPAANGADKLRISYSAVNATQAFLWVAQERGIFARHGLEGELLYINSGTMNIAALKSGTIQLIGGASGWDRV